MSDTEELERSRFEDWVVGHPQAGFVIMMAVVEIYLLFQTVPGLLDPKTRWAYAIFLAPMNLAVMAIAVMMVRLQRAVARADAAHEARKKQAEVNVYRQQLAEIQAAREKAIAQGFPVVLAQQAEVELETHEADECDGPGYLSTEGTEDVDGDGPWKCPICRTLWKPYDGTWLAK